MRPIAKSQMAAVLPTGVEPGRTLEGLFVAIGRGVADADHAPGGNDDITNRGVAGCHAIQQLDWRLQPQHFLDERRNLRWVLA